MCDTVTSLTALGLPGFAPPVCQCPLVAHELSAAAAADSRLSALARTTTRLVTDKSSSVTAYKESWKEWGEGGGSPSLRKYSEFFDCVRGRRS